MARRLMLSCIVFSIAASSHAAFAQDHPPELEVADLDAERELIDSSRALDLAQPVSSTPLAPIGRVPGPQVHVDPTEVSSWARVSTEGPAGIRDPVFGHEMDDGLIWNGLGLFLGSYLTALAASLPFSFTGCVFSCNEAWSVFNFIPLAQWGAIFGGNFVALIMGIIFAFFEFAGGIMLIVGVSHHHPTIRSAPAAGTVAMTGNGFEVTF